MIRLLTQSAVLLNCSAPLSIRNPPAKQGMREKSYCKWHSTQKEFPFKSIYLTAAAILNATEPPVPPSVRYNGNPLAPRANPYLYEWRFPSSFVLPDPHFLFCFLVKKSHVLIGRSNWLSESIRLISIASQDDSEQSTLIRLPEKKGSIYGDSFFILGLGGLFLGAEWLVRGSSSAAFRFGISPLVVGLTVVAFGTSSPELGVSLGAALSGKGDISLGNVIGSNIANIALILGVAALIRPIRIHRRIIRHEIPIMLAITLVLLFFLLDQQLNRWEDFCCASVWWSI